jgi:hypothetical protein
MERHVDEDELEVGLVHVGSRALERADLAMVVGAGLDRPPRLIGDAGEWVVVEVRADARKVVDHVDAQFAQVPLGTESRQHQELRRADGAGGEHDLLPRPGASGLAVDCVLDPDAAIGVEQKAQRQRGGLDREARAAGDRLKVGGRRALARPIDDVEVVPADALGLLAVAVLGLGDARLERGVEERLGEGMSVARRRHAQRSADAAVGRVAALGVLRALEVRQQAVVVPTRGSVARPAVEVAPVSADVGHGVDRARAAEHLALRHEVGAAGRAGLGHGRVAPVDLGPGQRRPCLREPQQVERGRTPRFEEEHPRAIAFRQPRREHATGRACSHDHVVEVAHRRDSRRPRPPAHRWTDAELFGAGP